MLSPTTLTFSVLVLVLGDRPLRTGLWFYVGGLGATLGIGIVAAFVLGDAAADRRPSTPTTAVAILLLLVAREWAERLLEGVRRWLDGNARTIAAVIIVALAASLIRNGIAGLTS